MSLGAAGSCFLPVGGMRFGTVPDDLVSGTHGLHCVHVAAKLTGWSGWVPAVRWWLVFGSLIMAGCGSAAATGHEALDCTFPGDSTAAIATGAGLCRRTVWKRFAYPRDRWITWRLRGAPWAFRR